MTAAAKPPKDAEIIEMVTGIIYFSRDKWQTIFEIKPGAAKARRVPESRTDLVRFLAASQSSASNSF